MVFRIMIHGIKVNIILLIKKYFFVFFFSWMVLRSHSIPSMFAQQSGNFFFF